ncbi:cyclodeaminase/cyclohydrolase family protein [Anaeroselena agilis]|uniref:Cyclodeaminase/cyclohydrolase family protein n=1 Tax=Anaeroselena agilis TaxID=3063788 RepID=A0ABU3P2R5_9FIRM|nr:cyclodeaminase/cyclohydrolase family protein [Selenomonadales bacterium 4137-cl]
MLTTLTVNEFTARLASQDPAPGGGSAAALSGLLGASLVEMAISLTRGRREFAAREALLAEREAELSRLRVDLQLLVDRDAAAFTAVMSAYGLPEKTRAEQEARAAAIQEAMREAAEVPLLTARACLAVLQTAEAVLGAVNPHAVSDLTVGVLSCHAGLMGALLNVAVNLPGLTDTTVADGLRRQLRLLRAGADDLTAAIQAKVYGDPTFAAMRE